MAQKKRIAVALEFPLAQRGGTEALVRALILALSQNFEIVLVSGDDSRANLPPEFSGLVSAHFHWSAPPKTAAAARQLAGQLREQKIQLAHFHFGGTYDWGSNRFWRCPAYYLAPSGVPCLSTNHLATGWLDCGVRPTRPVWQKQLYQLFAIFSRSQTYRRLKLEICVSKHDHERVLRQFPFFKNKIIQVYHSVLDAAEPLPQLENRDRTILSVGHFTWRKGQIVLAEAFAGIAGRHPGWRLQFAGAYNDGNEIGKIKRLIENRQLDSRIQLLVEPKDVIGLMRRAAIYVQASFKEGLGLALQEALYHGCAAIGTRAGGIPELVDDGENGLLVEPGNVTELAATLERMISGQAFRARCAARARPSILDKGMTAEKMVQAYEKLYEEILSPR
jgi:glycosyltransferase involved in cell wall biosynthesis